MQFNKKLQRLLRAALFDAGGWCGDSDSEGIETVPAGLKDAHKMFTSDGLMANEIKHAPLAVLSPLLRMLKALDDFSESSLYSADASLLLFLIGLALDVNGFVIAICPEQKSHLREVLMRKAKPMLERWAKEAKDVSARCVVRAYLALLWRNISLEEMTTQSLIQMLGNVLFVRNWHGFGMAVDPQDSPAPAASPEQRLLRFLQAYGVDTSGIGQGSLQRYIRRDKQLFLRVGVRVVRVPSLFPASENAGVGLRVPEQRVMELVDRHRHQWLAHLTALGRKSAELLNNTLREVVRLALPSKSSYALAKWSRKSGGAFECEADELIVDVDSAEMLWRNQGIYPLPDALTQYTDLANVFGKRQLHCGTVAMQQHRSWLHIVGSEFDIVEWDKPDLASLGKAFPQFVQPSLPAPHANGGIWPCPVCTFVNQGGDKCEMCETPIGPSTARPEVSSIEFNGLRFNRPFDAFDKSLHEKLRAEEAWLADILCPLLKAMYKEKMPFPLFLQEETVEGMARLVGRLDKEEEGEEMGTWKEVEVLRAHGVVQVFNLISSGRQMYKQLCFSSHRHLSLHSGLSPHRKLPTASGDFSAVSPLEPSLNILRAQDLLIPGRLLVGTIPDAILSNYRFWLGADGILRGEPLDPDSTFFAHHVHVLPDRKLIRITSNLRSFSGKSQHFQQVDRNKTVKSPNDKHVDPPRERRPQRVQVQAMSKEEVKEVDEDAVIQLCALGFSLEAARAALERCGNSASLAADWLLDPRNAALAHAPPRKVEERWRVVSHKAVQLREMPGSVEDEAFGMRRREVLRFGQVVQVVEIAGSWLKIQQNGNDAYAWAPAVGEDGKALLELYEEVGADVNVEQDLKRRRLENDEESSDMMKTDDVNADEAEGETEEEQEPLVLVNLLEPGLEDVVSQLVRIEDLSHVLAWSDGNGLRVIELPRLKLRLAPSNGRLFVMDYAGWFLSSKEVGEISKEGVVLENGRGELQVLIGSHPVDRPALAGDAFPTTLVYSRGSKEWLDTMDTRFFLYPVHSSGSFLHCEALSASIYLVLLHLLKRNYAEAFELASACTTDTALSNEEGFVWKLLEKCADDRHPDAHACRLKLSLCISFTTMRTPWQLHEEYSAYLAKLPRVSLACRLHPEEELRVAKAAVTGPAIIRNRVNVLLRNDTALTAPRLRNGGLPWVKLGRQPAQYLHKTAVGLKRVQLDRSSSRKLSFANILLQDLLISDEESGANRKLGFAYLYELLLEADEGGGGGRKELDKEMGILLARWMHLKLCRWGKESVAEGEQQLWTSKAMAHLVALAACPDLDWPRLPSDALSVDLLRRGINLYDAQGRTSAIKAWLDHVDTICMQAWPGLQERVPAVAQIPKFDVFSATDCHRAEPPRPDIVDTSCRQRKVPVTWATMPLFDVAEKFTQEVPLGIRPAKDVPFDLSGNPASSTVVAQEMLTRLKEDVRKFAEMQENGTKPVFQGEPSAAQNAILQIREADRQFISAEIVRLEEDASSLRACPNRLTFQLQRHAGLLRRVSLRDMTRALISANGPAEITGINPTLTESEADALLYRTAEVLLRCSRIAQASRAEEAVREGRLGDASSHLRMKRHYLAENLYDPRYLVFEYAFDLLLRERQVEIVQSFARATEAGESRVQQMIMGAGKTTVVGPLLTLLLADGKTMVTHVMPTALLEQSKQILRSRFSSVVNKEIYKLSFDRTIEDSQELAQEIFKKLQLVRRSRAVLCCPPEAVKSLFLKVVEHLSVLHQVDPDILRAPTTASARKAKTLSQLRATVQCKSDMADALVQVIELWKDAVLIMDEVSENGRKSVESCPSNPRRFHSYL